MMTMTQHDDFAESYAEARAKFHDACHEAGAPLESHDHPLPGPDGERLTLDVARLGPRDAGRVLVICSATHGVEGFCGSAAQIAWLSGRPKLPESCAVLLVHGLNPHGFAWLRRVNEDNVDLNRNFVDFQQPLPRNPGYHELAGAICPSSLEADVMARAQETLGAYQARHGRQALIEAIVGGQYSHPTGLFYGGRAPAWSNRVFRQILARELAGARRVAYMDIHSGYGRKGEICPLGSHGAATPGHQRLERWLELPVQPSGAANEAFPTTGDTGRALFDRLADGVALTAFCLEFGTEPEEVVLGALRRENWLHHHGQASSARARDIKAELRAAFCPPERSWRQAVQQQSAPLIDKLVAGLAA